MHTELESFLRGDAKWTLAMICRPVNLKFFWKQIVDCCLFLNFAVFMDKRNPKQLHIVTSKVVNLFKYRKLSSLYLLVKQMRIELVFLQLHTQKDKWVFVRMQQVWKRTKVFQNIFQLLWLVLFPRSFQIDLCNRIRWTISGSITFVEWN